MSRGMHRGVVHNKFTMVIFHHHAIGKRVPMNKRGVMVKGLLALIGLVFKVFKSFSFFFSNYFVKYGIYRRK